MNPSPPVERATMATWSSPAVARRWLACELRRLRENRGLAQKDVGKACGWSAVRVSYLEKWDHPQRIFDRDLDKLLPLYEVAERDRADFYAATEASHEKGWWEKYDESIVPRHVGQYIGLEQGAAVIRAVEPNLVPGLLQTRDYVVATLETDVVPWRPRHIEDIAAVRLARQEALHRPVDPVELRVVLDESVLRRVAANPATMAAQLAHLREASRWPSVDLRVFPFAKGLHAGMATTYRALEFSGGEPGLVYIEHREGAVFLEDAVELDEHMRAFDDLVEAALNAEDSAEMIGEAAADYSRRG